MINAFKFGRIVGASLVFLSFGLSGCTTPKTDLGPNGIFDPHEAANRETHELNRKLDRALVRPAGKAYTKVLSDPVEDMIVNFADNLGTPGSIVNQLLQGRFADAGKNTVRFSINTVFGFGGLFNAAGDFGVEANPSDFGETLYVWGLPEGAYVELPLLGPSTERDTAGKVVDFFIDPLGLVIKSPEKYYGTAAGVASKVGQRGRYSDTVDSILYESADSYSQAQMMYLQSRRHELRGEKEAVYEDPYKELYGE